MNLTVVLYYGFMHKLRRRIIEDMKKILFLCGLLFLTLIGCKKQQVVENVNDDFSWKEDGLRYEEHMDYKVGQQLEYSETECVSIADSLENVTYSERYISKHFEGASRYCFYSFLTDLGWRYYLEIYNAEKDETSLVNLLANSKKYHGPIIFSDSVKGGMHTVILEDVSYSTNDFWLLKFESNGNLLTEVKISEDYRDILCRTDAWWCDQQGNMYLRCEERTKIVQYDAEGTKIGCFETKNVDSKIDIAFHSEDNNILFVENDILNECTYLWWVDEGKRVDLVTIPETNIVQFTMKNNGTFIYSHNNIIIQWSAITGERIPLFRYLESNIPEPDGLFEYTEHIACGDNNEYYVYVVRRDIEQVYKLSSTRDSEEKNCVTIVDMTGGGGLYISSATKKYNLEHKSIDIQYKTVPGDEDDAWNQIMAEFVAEDGPDMILAWAGEERIKSLYEKNVLLKLDDYLSEEINSNLFDGVKVAGSFDGKLYGVGFGGYPIVLVCANSLWDKDTWTVEDIINISSKNKQLEGLCLPPSNQRTKQFDLRFSVCYHMGNMASLCKNDMYLFGEILNVINSMGSEISYRESEKAELLKEEKILAVVEDFSSISQYFDIKEKYGDDCHFMGFVGQEEYSGYWSSLPLLFVNKNSKKLEAISEYLNYLLAVDNLKDFPGIPVRKDNCLREINKINYDNHLSREDVDEIISSFNNLGPLFGKDTPIVNIITEETETFFSGAKQVEKVIETISNRTQLLYDEQQ